MFFPNFKISSNEDKIKAVHNVNIGFISSSSPWKWFVIKITQLAATCHASKSVFVYKQSQKSNQCLSVLKKGKEKRNQEYATH